MKVRKQVIHIPRRPSGYQHKTAIDKYKAEMAIFAGELREVQSRLDFKVSARGWCYLLEPMGLSKGDFDIAEKAINRCREMGLMPIDFCAMDESRAFVSVESVGDLPEAEAESLMKRLHNTIESYQPISFWDDQKYYLQMMVEKIDLKTLFKPICEKYHIPLGNAKGWSDLNGRAAMMQRFKYWESRGKICRLLYCGDFDPYGVKISDTLIRNMNNIAAAVGWSPDDDLIDRFGLNKDFIDKHNLTWIENLVTSSKKDLANPNHNEYKFNFVQKWLREIGARKVEANVLVAHMKPGRKLCQQAINRYVKPSTLKKFQEKVEPYRQELLDQFIIQISDST